ncbi:MAG TPA: UpxY family transcription antiterminator [Chitinophagaceae bacterium]|jgi:transcription antitermination factor NusG|nr:UpxY family transcription antiterminator [Chitinophagaceae bacterium]
MSTFNALIISYIRKKYVTEVAKLCKLLSLTKRWLAVYTRPRWEKKAARLLEERGIECYCPLNKIRRKWSDRIKVVEEPLFKSYVFVKIADEHRLPVRTTAGVINFVYWDGKPAVIKEKEIEAIKRFLDEYENVEAYPVGIKVNQRVRITNGSFMDLEGKVVELKGKFVKVVIDSLGYLLVAYIEKKKVQVVAESI